MSASSGSYTYLANIPTGATDPSGLGFVPFPLPPRRPDPIRLPIADPIIGPPDADTSCYIQCMLSMFVPTESDDFWQLLILYNAPPGGAIVSAAKCYCAHLGAMFGPDAEEACLVLTVGQFLGNLSDYCWELVGRRAGNPAIPCKVSVGDTGTIIFPRHQFGR